DTSNTEKRRPEVRPQGIQLLASDTQDSVQKGSLPAMELDGPRVPEDEASEQGPQVLLPHLLFWDWREERDEALLVQNSPLHPDSHPAANPTDLTKCLPKLSASPHLLILSPDPSTIILYLNSCRS
ncbi:hypothetical protein P7K49_019333, partial [Saguinus oedipus]